MAFFFAILFFPSSAWAADAAEPRACVAQSAAHVELEDLLNAGTAFNCGEDRFSGKSPRFWLYFDLSQYPHFAEQLQLESENSHVDRLQIHIFYRDGTRKSLTFLPHEIAGEWRPKNTYALDLPRTGKGTATGVEKIYVAVDNPFQNAAIKLMRVERTAVQTPKHLLLLAMFALLMGMALVPIIYNLFFYRALNHKFMLWHCLTIFATLSFTYSSSGFLFMFWDGATMELKTMINYTSLAVGVSAGCIFMIYYLEPDKLSRRVKMALITTSIFPVGGTLLELFPGDFFGLRSSGVFYLGFIPALLMTLSGMIIALIKGSRAAIFQCVAWIPIILLAFDRVARGANFYEGYSILDYGLYFALVLETMVIALGVADRVFLVRQERDQAQYKARRLEDVAETDPLTGLANRRGLKRLYDSKRNSITGFAIIDLDHFKDINDRHGHNAGDEVLKAVAAALNGRKDMIAARIGGEEFAVMLTAANALQECEGLRRAITQQVIHRISDLYRPVTASCGLFHIDHEQAAAPLSTITDAADKLLYQAKNSGRNKTVCNDAPVRKTQFPAAHYGTRPAA